MITEVFETKDSPITKGIRSNSSQSPSAGRNKTSGNDREKIENGKNGLTSATVIKKNRDENDVHKDLGIGERGITLDELQSQC